MNVFQRKYRQLIQGLDNKKIINTLEYLEEFDVLSINAFKFDFYQRLKHTQEGTLFMADIDNLYIANMEHGERVVNKLIKELISIIRQRLDDLGMKDYQIGKMGDELYIYIPNCSEEQSQLISTILTNERQAPLAMSCGYTRQLDKGMDEAFSIVEEDMKKNKREKKPNRLKNIDKDNISELIKIFFERNPYEYKN